MCSYWNQLVTYGTNWWSIYMSVLWNLWGSPTYLALAGGVRRCQGCQLTFFSTSSFMGTGNIPSIKWRKSLNGPVRGWGYVQPKSGEIWPEWTRLNYLNPVYQFSWVCHGNTIKGMMEIPAGSDSANQQSFPASRSYSLGAGSKERHFFGLFLASALWAVAKEKSSNVQISPQNCAVWSQSLSSVHSLVRTPSRRRKTSCFVTCDLVTL